MIKKPMTRAEMGRKGGTARANKYSKADLSRQSKQAAKSIIERFPRFYHEIGQKGGKARAQKYSQEQLSEQSQKGAVTVEERYPGFHSKIGSKGGKNKNIKNKYHENLITN